MRSLLMEVNPTGKVYQPNRYPVGDFPKPYYEGWICPICHRSNSPWTRQCSCSSQVMPPVMDNFTPSAELIQLQKELDAIKHPYIGDPLPGQLPKIT
jgi:hypothetical protein